MSMTRIRSRRRGVTLTEIMIAMAVAAGPMILALSLIRSNNAGARFNKERATARLVLVDLAELLMGETEQGLRDRLADGARLEELLQTRIAHMPEPARGPYEEAIKPIRKSLSGNLEDSTTPGLVKMNIRATTTDEKTIVLTVLFRPKARQYLAGNWGANNQNQGGEAAPDPAAGGGTPPPDAGGGGPTN